MVPKKKVKNTSQTESKIGTSLGRDQATTSRSTPAPPEDHTTSPLSSASSEASVSTGPDTSSQENQKNWPSLRALWDTLTQAAAISGLGPIKSVIEGLVELIMLYENVVEDQKSQEYDELRVQLECIFDELNHHISSSPVVTSSVDNICWSIWKEIELVKTPLTSRKWRWEGAGTDSYMILECYRRIQSHLKRLARNANVSAWKIVDELATENRLQKLCPSLWACYNSEKAPELERRSCTYGTRTNTLAQMHQWVTSPHTGNIYWMSGMAGTGKTTIAYSMCEQLDNKTSRMLCASFFCSRSLPECRDVGRIIPSIAYQLAQCSQPFQYALSQATEKEPLAHTRLPQLQFESLIAQPFSDAKVREAFPTNMVVVIDALDECDDVKSTKLILDVLLTKSKDLPIKFVVSSRPEPAIRDQMDQNGTWVDARVVLHELDSGEVQTDIRTYLKTELAPILPSDSEIEQLVDRAGVLFIYAATVVRYVGADNFKRNPRARLKKVVDISAQRGKAQTMEIDQLYGAILDAAAGDVELDQTERDDMKLILDTVICTREPLAVDTLNGLLKLNDVGRVHAALRPLWSVLHVMGPDMTVSTLHASFPDYLFDPQRSGAWHCDAKAHHQLLAQRCFECIRDTHPQFNICRLESSYLLDDELVDLDLRVQQFISSELSYACRYWPRHLDVAQSSTESVLVPLLSQFISTHLLLWMEIRSLTKTVITTVAELTSVKRWATGHDMPPDTLGLLTDAWRFASTFVSSPVSQSTPHLYISMLPLLPSSNLVRKYYLGRFKGLLGVEGTALERRKSAELAQWKLDSEFYVRCMTCSPDGARIAVGGDGGIYVLDTFTGSTLCDLSEDHTACVTSVAFSPDATRLVSGYGGGSILIWDVINGQLILRLFGSHDGWVSSILYSHDGSYIVSADETVRTWDALTGKPASIPIIKYPGNIECIAISSDDTLLVSGSRNGVVHVWDMRSGHLVLGPMKEHRKRISTVALSPDDSYIVSVSYDRTIIVRETRTGQMVYSPITYNNPGSFHLPISISISPDGTSIASAYEENEVHIWDAASGKLVSRLGPFSEEFCPDNLNSATYSPDGTCIIYLWGGTIRLLDAQATGQTPDPLPGHIRQISSIDISPNSRHLVSGSDDWAVCVWDIADGALTLGPLQGHTEEVVMVRFSTDGSRIVSCSNDSTIRQWDTQSGAAHGTPIQVPSGSSSWVASATYSPDDAYILSIDGSGNLWVWNSSDGQSILGPLTFAGPTQSWGAQTIFSPDGAAVITGFEDGWIGVWDMQSGQLVFSHQPDGDHKGVGVFKYTLSPNGLFSAQGTPDGRIILRNIHAKGHARQDFQAHSGRISCLGFSPDGLRLAFYTSDHAAYVWDVESGRYISGPLRGHTSSITSVAFSLGGRYLTSASEDVFIRVWDVQLGESLNTNQHAEYADWILNEDGWVVSGGSNRLFWVPVDLRDVLLRPRNTMVLCREGYMRLKFEGARIGETWADCWCDGSAYIKESACSV